MLNLCQISVIESKINYHFKNKKLLQQAFIRKSYAASNCCEDNEVLEFLGDRVLDYAVIKDMYERFGRFNNQNEFYSEKSVNELSKLDSELIKNSNLAEQIDYKGLKKYLQVSYKSERKNMKNKADLFEAILGAVAIDSNWDVSVILNVYRSMIVTYGKAKNIFTPINDNYIDTFETLVWRYQICKTENKIIDDDGILLCKFVIIINGKACEIKGRGKYENEAISAAYETASKLIYLVVENQFIKNETYTNQLYLLYNYGFISEPQYHFEYFPRNSNIIQDVWRCYLSFPESENEFMTEDLHMSDAREQASYAMLCDVLGIEEKETDMIEESEINKNYISVNPETIIRGQGLLKHILSMYKNVA